MSDWTPELKAQIVEEYLAKEPTAESSMEIVSELAELHEKTPNGVRLILTQAQVYIKKAAGTPAAGAAKAGTAAKAPRVSKADCIAELTSAITDAGGEPDSEILDKLTGKAAQYFTGVLRAASTN